jgi:hypothetical protein
VQCLLILSGNLLLEHILNKQLPYSNVFIPLIIGPPSLHLPAPCRSTSSSCSTGSAAASTALQSATAQLETQSKPPCSNAEVAAHPTQVMPHGFTLPRGLTTEAVLQHIEQLPVHLLLAEARAADGASRSAATAASEVLITGLRQCDL